MTPTGNQEVIPEKELSCDVLVVGTGLAGLTATLRALERKANVLTIEKLPRGWWTPGGNMIISGGQVHLAMISMNTPEPQLRQALLDVTGNMIPRNLLDVTVKNSARALKWAMNNGVEFMETPGKEKKMKPAIPPPIWGRVKPGGVQDAAKYGNKKAANELEDRIYKKGGKILFETKALKLLTNVKSEVTGVMAQDKDGRFNIKAKSVILCTGGYERNAEMLVKYVGPHADEIIIYCGPGCTGDGFKMGEDLDVALRSMSYLAFSHYYSSDCYWKEDLQGIWLEDVGYQGILVNVDGNRFVDEALGERMIGSIMTKSSIYIKGWMVIDSAIYGQKEIEEKIAPLKEFGGTI
ncbi:MAG: FAD-dependent oxidoreductase, partial [Dehalococcoidales bacterium]|nr:FAD-dependent oxidoreductase [Dehalococcoidales bacterium]